MKRILWKWHFLSSQEMEAFRKTVPPEEFFTPWELQKYQAMTSPGRKRDFWAGRLAGKTLLRGFLESQDISPPLWSAVGIRSSPRGVPEVEWTNYHSLHAARPLSLATCPSLSISIAHCDGNAVAGISPALSVGVDIQRVRPISSQYIHRFLTPREMAHLHRLDPVSEWEGFYDFWVMKEAVAKALRVPLRKYLRNIEVFPYPSAHTGKVRLSVTNRKPSRAVPTSHIHLHLKSWKDYKIALSALPPMNCLNR